MLKKFLLLTAAFFVLSGAALGQGTSGTAPAASTEKPAKPPAFRATKDQIKQGQQILISG